jgi:hypothetical protein
MIRSRFWFAALLAAIAFVIFGLGMQIGAGFNYGPGGLGPGMMAGYRMSPWMMGPNVLGGYGYGSGPWMMGPWLRNQAALNLTPDDVKRYFERWLAWQGNPRLKLGDVTEKDVDSITADIVTVDKDGLVQRFVVNRHNGLPYPSEVSRCGETVE